MRTRPTERIKELLTEIEALRWWASLAESIIGAEASLPPIPEAKASSWEKGFRHRRGGQTAIDLNMKAQRLHRIRTEHSEESYHIRGRKEFGSLSQAQMDAIEREIEQGEKAFTEAEKFAEYERSQHLPTASNFLKQEKSKSKMKRATQVRSTIEQRYRQVGCTCGRTTDEFEGEGTDAFYQHIKQKGHKLKVWFQLRKKESQSLTDIYAPTITTHISQPHPDS